jgi:hypothetical protein
MSILQVNLGSYANDGTGDDLRTAFEKANANFSDIDLTRVISADNLGTGAGIFKEKVGNNLKLRSIKQGLNITVVETANEITVSTPDSINELNEDPTPTLGGNLNLNGYNIVGLGNVDIEGNVLANNFVGTLNGNIFRLDTPIAISSITESTGDFEPIVINALTISGNNSSTAGTTYISTLPGDGLNIISEVNLELTAVSGEIRLVGNVVTEDTITADTFIGNVIGNVNGIISRIDNHNLNDLGDISSTPPLNGQALVWNTTASKWGPADVISSSPGGDLDFGSFISPAGFSLDLGSF